jgi:2-haloacid dehalogenase
VLFVGSVQKVVWYIRKKPMSNSPPSIAVFDLGGVLIDWNPRYLYRKLFNGDDAAMEDFLATVCSREWNLHQDAGRSFDEGCKLLAALHPDKTDLIYAWFQRYDETLSGPIQESVDILAELKDRQTPLYALTNWNDETFAHALKRFAFLDWFDGLVVSGKEKTIKPEPQIYRILMERYSIDPREAVFIDDNEANVKAAQGLGFTGIHFTSPEGLRRGLQSVRLL